MSFFNRSHHFVASGTFVNVTNNFNPDGKKWGIDLLCKTCLPQAMHDSSARTPPLCHPGTREEYIHSIVDWGSGEWETRRARMLWMKGPAGVGKSALAQTCAEELQTLGKLGAGFFFFRANKWNDPAKFLPTIVYQLTTKFPGYRDVIDAIILRDPLVLERSIAVQFQELLVKPFAELGAEELAASADMVIVIDGLDECDGIDMQCAIVGLIIASVSRQTTPFVWAFFSRPEPHITTSFSSEQASNVCWQLTLPISRDADSDIEAYLHNGFKIIRTKYGFPTTLTWPSENQIRRLVDQSDGLFAYAANVIRCVGQETGALGPEEQLESVLESGEANTAGRLDNPLASLDQLYLFIMRQVPKAVLPNTLALLCVHLHKPWSGDGNILEYCSTLGLSLSTFHSATNNLHSVIKIKKDNNGTPHGLSFYHASFADFLRDVTKSTSEFCIDMPDVHGQCLKRTLNALCQMSRTNKPLANLRAWPDSEKSLYRLSGIGMYSLFTFAQRGRMDVAVLQQLSQINWRLAIGENAATWLYPRSEVDAFVKKISVNWRPQIVHVFEDDPKDKVEGNHYLLGHGSNTVLVICDYDYVGDRYHFEAYSSE